MEDIHKYNFTVKLTDKFDEITLSDKLKDIFYKEHSPVYQIQVKRHMGKFLISFMQNTTKFKSIMNSDNKIIYTVKYRTHDFKEFIEHIYSGLHKLINDEAILESLMAFKRAGASAIITYFALEIASKIKKFS